MLKRVSIDSITRSPVPAVDPRALQIVTPIVEAVRDEGLPALKRYAAKLDGWKEGDPLILNAGEMEKAFRSIPVEDQELLQRCAKRVYDFAAAQRSSLKDLTLPVPGGRAGHTVTPVSRAGCYAPNGRFPLPSTVLMNVCVARAAGVPEMWLASPKPTVYTLAAAYAAGASQFLGFGGAQAIAALAYGCGPVPRVDVISGPGNAYVTAAKFLVSQTVRIDMPAGPSELLVIADDSARADLIAADLVAQAEHGPDSLPILLSFSETLLEKVEEELLRALEGIPNPGAECARQSLSCGFACLIQSQAEAILLSNTIGPEHLQLMVAEPKDYISKLSNYGALFIGNYCAEVLGDYCLGPNHVLPTGGISRSRGGLSVFDFLKIQTWIDIDQPHDAAAPFSDAVRLGEIEGLIGHSRAARQRL